MTLTDLIMKLEDIRYKLVVNDDYETSFDPDVYIKVDGREVPLSEISYEPETPNFYEAVLLS